MGFLSRIAPDDLESVLASLPTTDVACRRAKDGTYSIAWDVPLTGAGSGIKSSSSSSALVTREAGAREARPHLRHRAES
jgi:hypothetical protein